MGRAPCCDKANVKKGPWSPEEDAKLKAYIEERGTGGNWIALPQKIGLKRCGKSCRLRWLNYLRPNIKHGGFSEEEENIICGLYVSIGSRWSIIAAQLPGRTDNDIKNYWNTRLKKKLLAKQRKEAAIAGVANLLHQQQQMSQCMQNQEGVVPYNHHLIPTVPSDLQQVAAAAADHATMSAAFQDASQHHHHHMLLLKHLQDLHHDDDQYLTGYDLLSHDNQLILLNDGIQFHDQYPPPPPLQSAQVIHHNIMYTDSMNRTGGNNNTYTQWQPPADQYTPKLDTSTNDHGLETMHQGPINYFPLDHHQLLDDDAAAALFDNIIIMQGGDQGTAHTGNGAATAVQSTSNSLDESTNSWGAPSADTMRNTPMVYTSPAPTAGTGIGNNFDDCQRRVMQETGGFVMESKYSAANVVV